MPFLLRSPIPSGNERGWIRGVVVIVYLCLKYCPKLLENERIQCESEKSGTYQMSKWNVFCGCQYMMSK